MPPAFARASFVLSISTSLACVRTVSTDKYGAASASASASPPPVGSEVETPSEAKRAAVPSKGPFVRDRAELTLDGVKEVWTLEWKSMPTTACLDEESFASCQCQGVAYAETGSLELVRRRLGAPTETLPLDVLFQGGTRLVRWAPTDDEKKNKKPAPLEAIVSRPLVPILAFQDFDHDGRASEFLLRISATCDHQGTVLVGIDKKNKKLHVFASVEEPDQALVLNGEAAWQEVRAKGSAEVLDRACASGTTDERKMHVTADASGLHASTTRKPCKAQKN